MYALTYGESRLSRPDLFQRGSHGSMLFAGSDYRMHVDLPEMQHVTPNLTLGRRCD
jgi:hypothetical protein